MSLLNPTVVRLAEEALENKPGEEGIAEAVAQFRESYTDPRERLAAYLLWNYGDTNCCEIEDEAWLADAQDILDLLLNTPR